MRPEGVADGFPVEIPDLAIQHWEDAFQGFYSTVGCCWLALDWASRNSSGKVEGRGKELFGATELKLRRV